MIDLCPDEFCGIDDELKKQLSIYHANFDFASQNNIALLLCGQTRTFVVDKINTAINDYIQQLKQCALMWSVSFLLMLQNQTGKDRSGIMIVSLMMDV